MHLLQALDLCMDTGLVSLCSPELMFQGSGNVQDEWSDTVMWITSLLPNPDLWVGFRAAGTLANSYLCLEEVSPLQP